MSKLFSVSLPRGLQHCCLSSRLHRFSSHHFVAAMVLLGQACQLLPELSDLLHSQQANKSQMLHAICKRSSSFLIILYESVSLLARTVISFPRLGMQHTSAKKRLCRGQLQRSLFSFGFVLQHALRSRIAQNLQTTRPQTPLDSSTRVGWERNLRWKSERSTRPTHSFAARTQTRRSKAQKR